MSEEPEKPAEMARVLTIARRRPLSGWVVAGVLLLVVAGMAMERWWPFSRKAIELLGNPPDVVDRLVILDTPDAWAKGTFKNTQPATRPVSCIMLKPVETDKFPRTGEWTSPEYAADFPFLEIIPSWNAYTPAETGLRIDMRVRQKGEWSPWLFMGSWGRILQKDDRKTRFDDGQVHIDFVTLRKPADAYQMRIGFQSFSTDPKCTPLLRRLSAVYSGRVDNLQRREALSPMPVLTGFWARDLPVPYRTQKAAAKSIRGEICSPTSVSMVCSYWGVDVPTEQNALAIYDDEYAMFGNWGRAVQRAAEFGLDSWVTRFRNWDQVKAQIEQGQPVIASIRFEKDEFPSNALDRTDGHLLVIRGFTPGGDVIVNDPASSTRGEGAVYRADEFAKAWFGHGGTGYIIRAKPGPSADSK